MKWYWGDLHCHTNLSYGRGTMQRAYEIALTHLDFCSVTGHAFWPDMPDDLQHYNDAITMHIGGFAKCRKYWPQYLEITNRYNTAGLVTFFSYEWHSDRYGDYNVYGKDTLELSEAQNPGDFEALLSSGKYLLVPHHIGYTENHRGIDWEAFRRIKSGPVIEVYSNHGCAISDDSPFDYYHSMGPRDGRRTAEYGLNLGVKFGFIASTDSHDGFPGHYSHGRCGVLAEAKTRDAIWQAIVNRRTVAVTGARIIPGFEVNGSLPGSEIKSGGRRRITYSLQGNQPFRYVEIVKNGRVIFHRGGNDAGEKAGSNVYYVKLEWGWGMKDQVFRWDNSVVLTDGRLAGVEPCYRPSILDSEENASPHRITEQTEKYVRWTSVTRGIPDTFLHNPQTMTSGVNALILKIEATEKTRFVFRSNSMEADVAWSDLLKGSVVKHTGGVVTPAVKFTMPYAEGACRVAGEFHDEPEDDEDVYYLRGTQIDNESIWVSPVWVRR